MKVVGTLSVTGTAPFAGSGPSVGTPGRSTATTFSVVHERRTLAGAHPCGGSAVNDMMTGLPGGGGVAVTVAVKVDGHVAAGARSS